MENLLCHTRKWTPSHRHRGKRSGPVPALLASSLSGACGEWAGGPEQVCAGQFEEGSGSSPGRVMVVEMERGGWIEKIFVR